MTSDTIKFPEPSTKADDPFAASLRGFGLPGIAAILVIFFAGNVFVGRILMIPAGGMLVLIWAWRSRTPWHEIGYRKPAGWVRSLVIGGILGILLKLLMKIIVLPMLGADPVNQYFHFLAGNRALLLAATLTMVFAGFGEETMYRGFLFERMGKLFTPAATPKLWMILPSALLFGLVHYGQGVFGMVQGFITGLAFGYIFTARKEVWTAIFAHIAFDLTALAIIYLDMETAMAQWLFK